MNEECVVAIYANLENARQAVHILDRGDFPNKQISLVTRPLEEQPKVVADITLGDDCLQILTGNPVTARSGANRMITKAANRLLRLAITADTEDWVKWGYNNNVSPEMLAFVRLRPDLLHNFDPSAASNPSPRSVTCLDKGLSFDAFPQL